MGVLRSLGKGGHASAGSAEDTKGTTAIKPWGSTLILRPSGTTLPSGHGFPTRQIRYLDLDL